MIFLFIRNTTDIRDGAKRGGRRDPRSGKKCVPKKSGKYGFFKSSAFCFAV